MMPILLLITYLLTCICNKCKLFKCILNKAGKNDTYSNTRGKYGINFHT